MNNTDNGSSEMGLEWNQQTQKFVEMVRWERDGNSGDDEKDC